MTHIDHFSTRPFECEDANRFLDDVAVFFLKRLLGTVVEWLGEDRKVIERINALIGECLRDPFRGTGKPEPLRQNLTGWWSRRITGEHRLVYRVRGTGKGQALEVLSCRYHY